MNDLDELTKIWLIGTDQLSVDKLVLSETLQSFSSSHPDYNVLDLTILAVVMERAGFIPAKAKPKFTPDDAQEWLPIAPQEALGALKKLLNLLQENTRKNSNIKFEYCLDEWITLGAENDFRADEECIYPLLSAYYGHELFESAKAVTGERGKWLLKNHPTWRSSDDNDPNDDENFWQTGNHEQRIRFLTQLRATSPKEAFLRFEQGYVKDNAQERETFIKIIGVPQDETELAFYEKMVLTDKSVKVQIALAEMLLLTEQSSLFGEVREIFKRSIRFKKGHFLKKNTLELEFPDQLPAHWKKWGMSFTLLSYLPVSEWLTHCNLSLNELFKAGLASDASEKLFNIWLNACLHHQDHLCWEEWLRFSVEHKRLKPEEVLSVINIIDRLPVTQCTKIFTHYLKEAQKDIKNPLLNDVVWCLMEQYGDQFQWRKEEVLLFLNYLLKMDKAFPDVNKVMQMQTGIDLYVPYSVLAGIGKFDSYESKNYFYPDYYHAPKRAYPFNFKFPTMIPVDMYTEIEEWQKKHSDDSDFSVLLRNIAEVLRCRQSYQPLLTKI